MKKTTCCYIILIFVGILVSCKYKDGPLISFRSDYDRLTGTWKLDCFAINKNDETQQYIDSCNYNFRISFFDTGHYIVNLYDGNYDYGSNLGHPGQWGDIGFITKKTGTTNTLFIDLEGSAISSTGYELFRGGVSSRWETTKLTNKHLWLESIENNYDNSKIYYLRLKKI